MPQASQLGIKTESTYATAVTVDRFYEFESEAIEADQRRIEVVTRRASQRVNRSDRFVPYAAGAAGPVVMPLQTKSHGLWLTHAFGTAAIGSVTDSNYTQTFTIGSLTGKYFTTQVDRPFYPSGTSQAFTWAGCKVTKATWKMAVEGYLMAEYEIDAASQTTATALATPSYVTTPDVFSWEACSATIAGSAVEIKDWEVSLTNVVNVDRRYLRGSGVKKEPIENAMRVVEWSMTADFVDLTQYNRFVSATQAGAHTAIVITCDGPTAHAGATLPRFTLTLPAARFDEAGDVNVSGEDNIMVSLGGVGLYNGTDSALTATYRTTDSAA